MDIIEQQEIAREVLHKLEIIDPNCILAGGAPRNWYLEKKANDLDFYIHTILETEAQTQLRFRRLGIGAKLMSFDESRAKGYKKMQQLFRVYEFTYKEVAIQVMLMKTPTFNSVVDNFGVSVFRFWWKGDDIKIDHSALISLASKTLYIKEGYSEEDRYITKMKSYFPNFKVMAERDKLTDSLQTSD